MAIERIVVGFDGSQGARRAVAWTAALAAGLRAEVVVVQGYDPLDELGSVEPPVDLAALEVAARQRLAGQECVPLANAGVAHRARLVEGPGIDAIARVVAEEGADLVVIGSHGRTGWRERVLGRVATKLPAAVPCPVTLVPSADQPT